MKHYRAKTKEEGSMSKLKPCPFCGSDDLSVEEFRDGYRVICNTDGCLNSAARVTYLVEKSAITAWNKRATEEKSPKGKERIMINADAYRSDLDEISKALGALAEFIPTGDTKKAIERRKRFEEARAKIRSTITCMRNDYIPIEAQE